MQSIEPTIAVASAGGKQRLSVTCPGSPAEEKQECTVQLHLRDDGGASFGAFTPKTASNGPSKHLLFL